MRVFVVQGHGHAVYPLIYLPEIDDDSDEDEDDEGGNRSKKRQESKEEELISPDDLLITGSADTSIKIWSLYSGECLRVTLYVTDDVDRTYLKRSLFLDLEKSHRLHHCLGHGPVGQDPVQLRR